MLKLICWSSVLRSRQFIFVIGEKQTEFSVYAAIIAKQSEALNTLINGPMKEASDGKVIFEDVLEDTFTRFCQFAFAGDYITPDFTQLPTLAPVVTTEHEALVINSIPADEVEPETLAEIIPDNGRGTIRITKPLKKPSKRAMLRQVLDRKTYDTEEVLETFTARCEVRPNRKSTEGYATVLLGHARLYVFAEKWGIRALKALTLSKIHRTLTSFTLYDARRPDIVELLRYTFSNDNTPDRVDNVDELRSLVMLYTACEVEILLRCPEFLSLIAEGGAFAQDLVRILMKRIS